MEKESNVINAKLRFLAQTKGRREREGERKRKGRKRTGKEKGKWEVKLWQKRKKSQTPQPGIEPGTPANAADAEKEIVREVALGG